MRRLLGYGAYQCLELPLTPALPEATPGVGFTCREITPEELRRHAADPANDLGSEFAESQGSRRDVCAGVFSGSQLVSYVFLASQATPIDRQFRFEFPEDAAYCYKAFTREDWRGKRLQNAALGEAIRIGRKRPGIKRLVTLILSDNFPSLATFRRMGFRTTRTFRLFGQGRKKSLIVPCGCGDSFLRVIKTE